MRMSAMAPVLVLLVLAVSCREERDNGGILGTLTGTPNVEPVEDMLGAAVPLAYATTLAMAAMRGERLGCVSVTMSNATPPCSGSVTVALDQNCVLPLGDVGTGAIIVSGTWTSDSEAVLVAVCEGVTINARELRVRQAAYTASLSGDSILIAYANQQIQLRDTTYLALEQSGWTVSVATAGTLSNTSDDVVTLTGARQYAGNTEVSEVVLTNVKMRGSCARNPVSGTASVLELASGQSGYTVLSFHSQCDGRADVTATMYLSWIGDPIALNLLY